MNELEIMHADGSTTVERFVSPSSANERWNELVNSGVTVYVSGFVPYPL